MLSLIAKDIFSHCRPLWHRPKNNNILLENIIQIEHLQSYALLYNFNINIVDIIENLMLAKREEK